MNNVRSRFSSSLSRTASMVHSPSRTPGTRLRSSTPAGGSRSPYTFPLPGITVVKGAPVPARPNRQPDFLAGLTKSLREEIGGVGSFQDELLRDRPQIGKFLEDRHVLLLGGTSGFGQALATAILRVLGPAGSMVNVSRDMEGTAAYAAGKVLEETARNRGLRYTWSNDGVALDGEGFGKIYRALSDFGAENVVMVYCVAAASSGRLAQHPEVYVRDVDPQGDLFQWELDVLPPKAVQRGVDFMGNYAVQMAETLRRVGISVGQENFTDWRGSLDEAAKDPSRPEFGRNGAYDTSLHLPKRVIQDYVRNKYRAGVATVMDHFLPTMRTRALGFIPGGLAMANIYERLLAIQRVRHIGVPELAVNVLDQMARVWFEPSAINPFPRHDIHEAALDEWAHEVNASLKVEEGSPMDYRNWLLPKSK